MCGYSVSYLAKLPQISRFSESGSPVFRSTSNCIRGGYDQILVEGMIRDSDLCSRPDISVAGCSSLLGQLYMIYFVLRTASAAVVPGVGHMFPKSSRLLPRMNDTRRNTIPKKSLIIQRNIIPKERVHSHTRGLILSRSGARESSVAPITPSFPNIHPRMHTYK